MVVQRDGGERRNIDHILFIASNVFRQLGIERMNPLNDQHTFFIHYETTVPKLPFSGHKIVRWQLNLLLIKQCDDLIFKKFQVNSIKRFVIFFAKFIKRSQVAIDKIIIK
ncbi:hypothetical protein SDC9_151041 [bioreactor metagenome]|uniref:Uncharacterized protein n=1 Tax=bioreactor metagenome TaxID=1076179 RepID=A0A645EPQ8_9ZZZZ